MQKLARFLLGVAVTFLPHGVRRRYREEFDAEILRLGSRRGVMFAMSGLTSAPRLRWEVLAGLTGGRPSLLCYVGRHDTRVVHPNPDDRRIIGLECRRCGDVRDPRQYVQARNADGVAWGGAYLSGGGGL